MMGIYFSRNVCLLKLIKSCVRLIGCRFMLMNIQPAVCYCGPCASQSCRLRHVALTSNPTPPLSWPSCSASLRGRRGSSETMTPSWKFRKEVLSHEIYVHRCIVTNFFIIKPTRCTNFTNLFWHEGPAVA